MSGTLGNPPGPMEEDPIDESVADLKESCEQSKNQLESLKDIMLRNKETLKKKEEEIQEYAKKLSKFKSRRKYSQKSKDGGSGESVSKFVSEATTVIKEDDIEDISHAKTTRAKSSLLQKKLAEDKKIFEQRNKEITESKRAAEEKVGVIKQQLEEREQQIAAIPQDATSLMQMSLQQDKDNKIAKLNNRILELEASIADLQENLKEKDTVIESKTKAITLMSADLSKKGKTTLDTLELTKDEMRTMQEHFVLLETSLKNKNENLLEQLKEKSDKIIDLEQKVKQQEDQLEAQKLFESASADFSKSTMDTLADTKDAMKSMQENFVLIESSLKSKNQYLLEQLEEREMTLAEARERIFQLETDAGIIRLPENEELELKLEKVEKSNRRLQDEKYELQKTIADMQMKIITLESTDDSAVIIEKNNRIGELENLIDELKKSNQLLQEESNSELQKQVADLLSKNEELLNKVTELEKVNHDLESEKNDLASKIPIESLEDNDKVSKLTRDLDELNKSMIKLKAQHKNKIKNLQKQLENFRKVSDVNAELVKLGNQVALLEEEKGNLQLSLVDFDELKASSRDWKEQINELEGKVDSQAKEIQAHIEAIAALENQKLDLIQELHSYKQEISNLEAENAESENLRVTAEMKVVDLEEQLDAINKVTSDQKHNVLMEKFENMRRENEYLHQKIVKLEEKGTSDAGSTGSFETIHETDRSELLRKIDELTQRNNDLMKQFSHLEEKTEEKGSSDTGSTESFEKIPEQSESVDKIEMLTRENNELVIKLTKLEEKLREKLAVNSEENLLERIQKLIEENNELVIEITKLREKYSDDNLSRENRAEPDKDLKIQSLIEENNNLKKQIEDSAGISEENQSYSAELSRKLEQITKEKETLLEKIEILKQMKNQEIFDVGEIESTTVMSLTKGVESCKNLILEQKDIVEDMELKFADKEKELDSKAMEIHKLEISGEDVYSLRKDLQDSVVVIEEWKRRCDDIQTKMNDLETVKVSIEEKLHYLQDENRRLVEEADQREETLNLLKLKLDNTISTFESKLKEQVTLCTVKDDEIATLKDQIKQKEKDLTNKYAQLQNEMITIDSLQDELDQRKNDLQEKDSKIIFLTEEINELKISIKKKLTSAKREIEKLQEQLKNSKSVQEFNEIIEKLEEREELLSQFGVELQNKNSEIGQLQLQIKEVNQRCRGFENELNQRDVDLQNTRRTIEELEEKIKSGKIAKIETEKQIEYMKNVLETNNKYSEDLKKELDKAYQSLEQLKMKHVEDMELQNRRIEDVIEDLHSKIQESESVKIELDRTKKLIGQNVTEEMKKALEAEVNSLKQQFAELNEKSQKQLEKMKKIAANLKKKTAQCEELERKVINLEENLSLEKEEKEAKNRDIQEMDALLRDKDNQILSLESEYLKVKGEKEEDLLNIERLRSELNELKSKFDYLMKIVVGMGEDSIEAIFEKCKKQIQDLDEAKDNVRELSVRMQVMEAEYVDQLSVIQGLKTENGMLISKQAQINEKLENVEKESEGRRIMLESLERELNEKGAALQELQIKMERNEREISEFSEKRETALAQGLQETQDKLIQGSIAANVQCERCNQCQSLVQALEARLQERDAEIENLDNELANSVVNFVQMQDNLRLNQSAGHSRSLQELQVQYNALTSSNEEFKLKLNETLEENQKLRENIEHLKEINRTLQDQNHLLDEESRSKNLRLTNLESELEIERKNLSIYEERIRQLEIELDKFKQNERSDSRDYKSSAPFFDAFKAFDTPLDNHRAELIKLQEVISEKEATIRSLFVEIDKLQNLISEKEELENLLQSQLEIVKIEREELFNSQESLKFKILQLENEIRNSSDSSRIRELEDRANKMQRENELLQLQINDLTRALDDIKESTVSLNNFQEVQNELIEVLREKEALSLKVNELNQALSKLESPEKFVSHDEKSIGEKNLNDEGETENIMIEEDVWGWNPEEARRDDYKITDPLSQTMEIQLQSRITELEDQVRDMEAEKSKIIDDNRNVQMKCAKLIKKLKEYKLQVETLQQQVRSRKLTSDLCDLDSVFNEEMKAQIAGLEKALSEAKEEHKKTIAERDNLIERLDVLMAANERHVEIKEKQDMEMEVYQIRNKELMTKLENLQKQVEGAESTVKDTNIMISQDTSVYDSEIEKYKNELSEVRTSRKALAAENEELQMLLEKQKNDRLSLELKLVELSEVSRKLEDLSVKNYELEVELSRLKEEYNILRKQYEQSLMDANDQVQVMRENSDILKEELAKKSEEFENEILVLRKEAEDSVSRQREEFEKCLVEKEKLKELYNQQIEKFVALQKTSEDTVPKSVHSGIVEAIERQAENLKRELSERERIIEIYNRDLEANNRTLEGKDQELQRLTAILESEQYIAEEKLKECREESRIRTLESEQLIDKLEVSEREIERLSLMNLEYQTEIQEFGRMKARLLEREKIVEELKQELAVKEKQLEEKSTVAPIVDNFSVFSMSETANEQVEELKAELRMRESQIEHLEATLKGNTYPQLIQDLQDTVNRLYDEKAQLELTLATFDENSREQLSEKDALIESLRQELKSQRQELVVLEEQEEDPAQSSRRKRSINEESKVQSLRDTLRACQQEVEELRQVLAEKEAQLMQASSHENKEIIQRLMSEKEQIRIDAEELLERKLMEKEREIGILKSQIEAEKEQLLLDLKLRDKDLENLRLRINDITRERDVQLERKNAEVSSVGDDLAERDRRLAELSITKDAEIHNLNVQIHEKEVRIEELLAILEEEEKQFSELKRILEKRDAEVSQLKQQLEEKVKEVELIQHALKRHIRLSEDNPKNTNTPKDSRNELDLALYMLHQRDVRCEELTLELMQLLEERDTLQLKLSNAIRINEELRKSVSPRESLTLSSLDEPEVEEPSSSGVEGAAVEIAKDALDSSINENKEALAQKLSQLHTVGHKKDVRLRDERELRHNQQMSFLTHKDILSTLPPEATAKVVNANHTLSRDAQSQSSVLMNWLWGKSTPKVMHM